MKKIHRFLLSTPIINNTITDTRVVHQITKVLRITNSQQCIFFTDKSDNILATIISQDKHSITIRQDTTIPAVLPEKNIIIAVSIPKGDAFELLTQKITEIGASAIIPLIAERTVKKAIRHERIQVISDEALEQCGGNNRVTIYPEMTLAQALQQFPYTSFFGDPYAEQHIKQIAEKQSLPHNATSSNNTPSHNTAMVLYIGPEGGWSDAELALLKQQALPLWLGKRILRTETAAITGCFTLLHTS